MSWPFIHGEADNDLLILFSSFIFVFMELNFLSNIFSSI
jgi:hypothetical protein